MNRLTFTKPARVSLRGHPDFDEAWLQERIAEDPSLLGLGDELVVIERERRQDSGGRLDMLLYEPDEDRRYEVELQLGPTDERHIIRCLEYWDIEKRRYPQYDHCAVLVAEDITSRFLNVISLLNGHIPIIAIQLNALSVSNHLVLDFVRVVDRLSMRRDDEAEAVTDRADREYWVRRRGEEKVRMCERLLEIVNKHSKYAMTLNFNRGYIGLSDGNRSRNFVHFNPQQGFFRLLAEVPETGAWAERLEAAGLAAEGRRRFVKVVLEPRDLAQHEPILNELIRDAVQAAQGE